MDLGTYTTSAFLMNGVAAMPNGRTVAVGYRNDEPANAPVAWLSDDDGNSWSLTEPPPVPPGRSAVMNAVAATASEFIAVGESHDVTTGQNPLAAAWLSNDGIRWESVVLPDVQSAKARSLQSVATAGNAAVAVGADGDVPLILNSPDGRNWVAMDSGQARGRLTAVAAGRDGFLAVGADAGDGFALSSADGEVWGGAGSRSGLGGDGDQNLSSVFVTSSGAQVLGGSDNGHAAIWWRYNPDWVSYPANSATWPNGGIAGFAEGPSGLLAVGVGYLNGALPDAAVWNAGPSRESDPSTNSPSPSSGQPSTSSLSTTPVPPIVRPVEVPRDGTVRGDVTIVAQQRPVDPLDNAQSISQISGTVTIVARFTGLSPHARVSLEGGDCTNGDLWVWSKGVADASGRVVLSAAPRRTPITHLLWLALVFRPVNPGPIVNGAFGLGEAVAHASGGEPCAP